MYNRKIYWNNTGLDMEYGIVDSMVAGEALQPLLGQLSWLAEQSCSHRQRVLTDAIIEAASGRRRNPGATLRKSVVRRWAWCAGLYAQPIRDAQGKEYDEILTQLRCDDGIMMPNQFIPLIARFNLSVRFDIPRVMEARSCNDLSARHRRSRGAFSVI